jgi:hypothetical protein
MSKKTIKIACSGAGSLTFDELNVLQGDLKSLSKDNYEKMRKEILKDGFSEPIGVWENPKDAKIYILSGTQRYRVLKKLRDEEGYSIKIIPVNYIEANDLKQAKRKILALASNYGKMDKQGFYEFLNDTDITAEELASDFNFNDLNMTEFLEEFFIDDPLTNALADLPPQVEGEMRHASSNVRQVQLFYDEPSHFEFMEKIEAVAKEREKENISDAVLELIREAYSLRK